MRADGKEFLRGLGIFTGILFLVVWGTALLFTNAEKIVQWTNKLFE